jgi:hypothetical protein
MLVDERADLHSVHDENVGIGRARSASDAFAQRCASKPHNQVEENGGEFLPDLLFVELGNFALKDALDVHRKMRSIANTTTSSGIPVVFVVVEEQVDLVHQ